MDKLFYGLKIYFLSVLQKHLASIGKKYYFDISLWNKQLSFQKKNSFPFKNDSNGNHRQDLKKL